MSATDQAVGAADDENQVVDKLAWAEVTATSRSSEDLAAVADTITDHRAAEVVRKLAAAKAALSEAQAAALDAISDPRGADPANKLAAVEAEARERYLGQLLTEAASKLAVEEQRAGRLNLAIQASADLRWDRTVAAAKAAGTDAPALRTVLHLRERVESAIPRKARIRGLAVQTGPTRHRAGQSPRDASLYRSIAIKALVAYAACPDAPLAVRFRLPPATWDDRSARTRIKRHITNAVQDLLATVQVEVGTSESDMQVVALAPNVDFLSHDLDDHSALRYIQLKKSAIGRDLAYAVYVYLEEADEVKDDEVPHLPLYDLD